MELQKLSPRHTFNVLEPGHDLATEKRLGSDTRERMNHVCMMFRNTESVKQTWELSQQMMPFVSVGRCPCWGRPAPRQYWDRPPRADVVGGPPSGR